LKVVSFSLRKQMHKEIPTVAMFTNLKENNKWDNQV
jgi:hypothetical protein